MASAPRQVPADPAEAMAQAAVESAYHEPAPSYQYQSPRGQQYQEHTPIRRGRKRSGDINAGVMATGIFLMLLTGLLGYFIGRAHMDSIRNQEAADTASAAAAAAAAKPKPAPQRHPDERVPPNRTPFKAVIPEGAKTTADYDIERFEAWVLTDQSNENEKAFMVRLKMKNITDVYHGYHVYYDFCTSGGTAVETINDYVSLHPGQNFRLDTKPPAFPAVVAKQFSQVNVRIKMNPDAKAPPAGS